MSSDGYDIIAHYQKTIKKSRNEEPKLLHCIEKLFQLPITIEHLQRTGVGKTINSLRKYNGDVGNAAKTLVAKWKTMVADGEISSKQDGQKLLEDEVVVNSMRVKTCESSPTNDVCHSKNNASESKSIKSSSSSSRHSNHQRKSDTRDKDTSILSNNSTSKHNDHKDKNSKESREKEKKRKSRHDEKYNSKSHSSSSSKSAHRHDESHRKSTMSNGSNGKEAESSNETISPKAKKPKLVEDGEGIDGSLGASFSDALGMCVYPKAKKAKMAVNEGIDSSLGASFSDALGMCSLGGSKKNKKSQKHHKTSSNKTTEDKYEQKATSSKVNCLPEDTYEPKATSSKLNSMPDALKSLPPGKLDISFNLPKITENYKPAPINQNVMSCIYPTASNERAMLSHADALSHSISSKTQRTKVYSGIKTGALLNVPSLFDICIRVLQKNIDALEYTGGVPFDVLRPVLERTTPLQLLAIEDFNAYLLEDTDILWQQHVGRNYRGKTKLEDENWREMYLRCEDDKEKRLSILTKNIKISQKQSALPVRKTRLAYVDDIVKPPRGVQRKQEIFRTNEKPVASPAARVAALASGSHNTAKAGDVRLKMTRGEVIQQAGGNQLRVKKAPLMAKTLQFIKKRYKR